MANECLSEWQLPGFSIPVRPRVLPVERVRQVDRTKAGGNIVRMHPAYALDLALDWFDHAIRQNRDAVLAAFAVARASSRARRSPSSQVPAQGLACRGTELRSGPDSA